MPARSATPRPPPPITARPCGPTRTTPNCSTAPSSRCSPRATSRKRCGSPSGSCRLDKNDRIARLVLGVRALKQKQYQTARQHLAQSVRGPITDLAATLLSAWAPTARATQGARSRPSTSCRAPDWYALFKDLHAGLILDLAGNKKEAGKRFERAHKLDATALRLVEAYGSLAVAQRQEGRGAQGLRGLRQAAAAPSADRRGDGRRIKRGEQLPPLVDDAAGRRRRSALRPGRRARPPRRRGSRPRLSAARALSAPNSRWRCSRSPISTSS